MGKSISGKSAKGRQHVARQRKYQKQFERTAKNKERAWKKHLANHPKDLQAREQIKKIK